MFEDQVLVRSSRNPKNRNRSGTLRLKPQDICPLNVLILVVVE